MAEIKASGQITIVDLSDSRQLSVYLTSNLPKTQVYDTDTASFTPNWAATGAPLVLQAKMFLDQKELTYDKLQSITWHQRIDAGEITPIENNALIVVNNDTLTVNTNVLTKDMSMITYICRIAYKEDDLLPVQTAEADITFALVVNPAKTKQLILTGEQAFKYSANRETCTPSKIILTATKQNVGALQWSYKTSTGYTNINNGDSTLEVLPSSAYFNGDVATIKVAESNNSQVFDEFSIYKLYDGIKGDAGTSALTAILSNESILVPAEASTNHPVSVDTTYNIEVRTFKGTTPINHTIGTVVTGSEGWSAQVSNGQTMQTMHTITLSATKGEILSSVQIDGEKVGKDNGQIIIPITVDGQVINKTISWTKAVRGEEGADAVSPVVFSVYAPNGTVIYNQENNVQLQIQAQQGTTNVVSKATKFEWQLFNNGKFQTIQDATKSSYEVKAGTIANVSTYKAKMQYDGIWYEDVITITDKTDTILAIIESSGGNIFKNGLGETVLTCKLMANGKEIDPLKTNRFVIGTQVSNLPSGQAANTYCYLINPSSGAVTLYKFNGSTWAVDSTHTQEYTYAWTAYSQGSSSTEGDEFSASGKMIYIDGSKVNTKTVFTCSVSK